MEKSIENQLREKGAELRANHDDEIIDDVIAEIEGLESESSDVTAEILRTMVNQ